MIRCSSTLLYITADESHYHREHIYFLYMRSPLTLLGVNKLAGRLR